MAYNNVGLQGNASKYLATFYDTYEASLSNSVVQSTNLVKVTPADGPSTNLGIYGSIPQMSKWNGPKQIKTFKNATATANSQGYEATQEVRRIDLMGNGGVRLQEIIALMGQNAPLYQDTLLAELLTCGDVNAKETYYPGLDFEFTRDLTSSKTLFATDHDTWTTAQSNIITGGLTQTTVMTACTSMKKFKGSDGLILGVEPKYLVIPAALYGDAYNAVEAQYAPGGSTTVNLANPSYKRLEIQQLNTLREENVAYVFGEVAGIKAATLFELEKPHLTSQEAGSFSDFTKGTYMFSSEAFASMKIMYWPMVIRITP